MKFAAVFCTITMSLFGSDSQSGRDYLQSVAPQWRLVLEETYANGVPKVMCFYEDRGADTEVLVKRVTRFDTGVIAAEEDVEGAQRHGLSVVCYPEGNIRELLSFVHGIKQGVHREFFQNGNVKIDETFDKDALSGKRVCYYEDGEREFECTFEDGKIVGEAISYYPSGKKRSIVRYKDGLKDGLAEEWYESGAVQTQVHYIGDKKHDYKDEPALKAYHENGSLRGVQHFDMGTPTKTHYNYHANGQVSEKASYKNGKLQGLVQLFSKDGVSMGETTYKEGKRVGKSFVKYENGEYKTYGEFNSDGKSIKPVKEWAPNGTLIAEYSLKDEKLDGRVRKWTDAGVLIIDGQYKEGEFAGVQKEYYTNGNIRKSFAFKNGKLSGLAEEWFQDGTPLVRASYEDGELHGEKVEWHSNGKMKAKGTFQKGKREGLHRVWDEKGSLVLEEPYEKGEVHGTVSSFFAKGQSKEVVEIVRGMRSGKGLEYYENGQMKSKVKYQNNKPEGVMEGWYEDGSLAFVRMFKDGNLVGEQKEFFSKEQLPEGQKKNLYKIFACNKEGQIHGEQKVFYPSGNLQSVMNYENGILNGKFIRYAEDGTIIEEGTHKKGRLHGLVMQKDSSGKEIRCNYVKNSKEGLYEVWYPSQNNGNKVKALEATYSNNVLEGAVKEYNESALQLALYHFHKGKKEGEAVFFNLKGQVIERANFVNDARNGDTVQYYTNGEVFKVTPYVNDVIEGEERIFYQEGTLSSMITYKDGKLSGLSKFWDQDGTLISEGRYHAGKKEGEFKKYYDDGALRLVQVYKDDTLVSKEEF